MANDEPASLPAFFALKASVIDSFVFILVTTGLIFFYVVFIKNDPLPPLKIMGLIQLVVAALICWPLSLLVCVLYQKRLISSTVMLLFSLAFLNAPGFILAYFSMNGVGPGVVLRLVCAAISIALVSRLRSNAVGV